MLINLLSALYASFVDFILVWAASGITLLIALRDRTYTSQKRSETSFNYFCHKDTEGEIFTVLQEHLKLPNGNHRLTKNGHTWFFDNVRVNRNQKELESFLKDDRNLPKGNSALENLQERIDDFIKHRNFSAKCLKQSKKLSKFFSNSLFLLFAIFLLIVFLKSFFNSYNIKSHVSNFLETCLFLDIGLSIAISAILLAILGQLYLSNIKPAIKLAFEKNKE
jgi:hypothetical protein